MLDQCSGQMILLKRGTKMGFSGNINLFHFEWDTGGHPWYADMLWTSHLQTIFVIIKISSNVQFGLSKCFLWFHDDTL